jgi:hypothetical protein
MNTPSSGNAGYGEKSAEVPPNTIAEAVKSLEQQHSEMCLLAEEAERIASMLCGPEARDDGASAKDHAPECMVDHLHRRIRALRGPARRIDAALTRINRRVG